MSFKRKHKNILFICEYVLNYIKHRQNTIDGENQFYNKMALIEEFREWITDGITEENTLYIISQNEISDKN